MKLVALVTLVASCGSPGAPPATPLPPIVDAAPDVPPPPPDADVPAEVTAAPAWIFRFASAARTETWTLQHAGGRGMLVVEGPRTTRYVGEAAPTGDGLAVAVTSGSAKLVLACKPGKLRASRGTCNDTKAPQLDVLECFHADFATPMTFGPAPGIEYVTSPACTGYRVIAAP